MRPQQFNHERLESKFRILLGLHPLPPLDQPDQLLEVISVGRLATPNEFEVQWDAGQDPVACVFPDEVTAVVGGSFIKDRDNIDVEA